MSDVLKELKTLFSAEVVEIDGEYYIQIPKREVDLENVSLGDVYKTALLSTNPVENRASHMGVDSTGQTRHNTTAQSGVADDEYGEPPVSEGETMEVDIESVGEEGDGVAKVDRGFVVIVENAEVGTSPRVEITEVKKNLAFADIVEEDTSVTKPTEM